MTTFSWKGRNHTKTSKQSMKDSPLTLHLTFPHCFSLQNKQDHFFLNAGEVLNPLYSNSFLSSAFLWSVTISFVTRFLIYHPSLANRIPRDSGSSPTQLSQASGNPASFASCALSSGSQLHKLALNLQSPQSVQAGAAQTDSIAKQGEMLE